MKTRHIALMEVDHIIYLYPTTTPPIPTAAEMWFIAKQYPQDDYQYLEAVKLMRYWSNSKQNKCTYAAIIERRIADVERQLYD